MITDLPVISDDTCENVAEAGATKAVLSSMTKYSLTMMITDLPVISDDTCENVAEAGATKAVLAAMTQYSHQDDN